VSVPTRFLQVTTTFATRADALRLGRALVRLRLAACCQVAGPVRSHYWWKGRRASATEWVCFLKTSRAAYARLESALLGLHPYENPEVVAVPLAGSRRYLAWLSAELADRAPAAGNRRSRPDPRVRRRAGKE
jgi:periplasmic divalent cation tolerance protein